MSKVYATARDFIDRELTTLGETPEGFDSGLLFDHCWAAGLIFYDDGWDPGRKLYISGAGFRWVDGVDDPETPEWAKLWGLIEQLIKETPGA